MTNKEPKTLLFLGTAMKLLHQFILKYLVFSFSTYKTPSPILSLLLKLLELGAQQK